MTPHSYLQGLLSQYALQQAELNVLQRIRGDIETCLRRAYGSSPRIYYGGSYGKDTMIRPSYDLDLVVYFPSTELASLKDIFWHVHNVLTGSRYVVKPKTVALHLPYDNGFHVDVVPGRAQDATFRYATLFKNVGNGSTLQTSLKVHIDAVRRPGIREIVKLMKLWRVRRQFSSSTFALEILINRALAGTPVSDFARSMQQVFSFIVSDVQSMRFVDPANSNNELDISLSERSALYSQAVQALNAPYWGDIVW
ncbi:nucleotidyltransferase domain-containing protein [Anaeromyxobacter oryzisoli]|uniref:nucleotidyltransferase domain-containing protein n=1 Tax=Anaeromyxobacter oryzisoli TaxID=2925408 RepID=UPI001F564563|nr:nucleotidyltransferase [Anaeromyxobacter sp. SG63]